MARLFLVGLAILAASACTPATIPAPAPQVLQVRDQPIGKILYVREGNLWVWEAGEVRQLTTGGTWRQPSLSPDGTEIAYAYWEQNFADLFTMASDGTNSRRLTRGQSVVVGDSDWSIRPAWSPDGSQIAFLSDVTTYLPVLWIMNKDGSGRRQIMTPASNLESADAIAWGPDGKRLAVTAFTARDPSQIYLIDVTRGATERFTSHAQGAFDPAWSPDGNSIAYIGRESGRGELWLRRVDGSAEAHFGKLPFVRSPAWSPDGRNLAVLSAQGGNFELWLGTVRTEGDTLQFGEFRQLTRDGGVDAVSGLSWAK